MGGMVVSGVCRPNQSLILPQQIFPSTPRAVLSISHDLGRDRKCAVCGVAQSGTATRAGKYVVGSVWKGGGCVE